MNLSKKHKKITPSLTLAISAKAKEMKASGHDVIGFGAGEPDFNTPEFIIEEAKKAMDQGKTGYTPAAGIKELKEAVCEKFKRDNGLNYTPDEVIVSSGAKHSLYNTLQAILNPGEEVVVPVPYWVSYPEMVKMAGGKPVFVKTEEKYGLKMKTEDLRKAITAKTKAIILNSPANPSGVVYSKEELKEIASIAVENKLIVISDEIYEKIIYDGVEHTSIATLGPEIKDLTIVINGMSKAYAMTGWRIGFAAGSKDIIDIMKNIQSHSTSNANTIAQYASLKALRDPQGEEEIKKMVVEFKKRREYMVEAIGEITGLGCLTPKGAFYVFVNIEGLLGKKYKDKKIDGSMTFADLLLEEAMVAVVPGKAFGKDNYIRLSYATSMANIKEGLERVKVFVKQL